MSILKIHKICYVFGNKFLHASKHGESENGKIFCSLILSNICEFYVLFNRINFQYINCGSIESVDHQVSQNEVTKDEYGYFYTLNTSITWSHIWHVDISKCVSLIWYEWLWKFAENTCYQIQTPFIFEILGSTKIIYHIFGYFSKPLPKLV